MRADGASCSAVALPGSGLSGLNRARGVISAGTFQVDPVVERGGQTPFAQPLNADRLARLATPSLNLLLSLASLGFLRF